MCFLKVVSGVGDFLAMMSPPQDLKDGADKCK